MSESESGLFSQENKVKKLERFFLSELKVTMFVSIVGYGDIEIDHLFVQSFPSFSTLSARVANES